MTRTLTRALANLPQSIVSVKDFGAVGNGVTDDTAEIQAAITAASGKILQVPAGTYLLNEPLSSSSNITYLFDPGAVFEIADGSSHIGGDALLVVNECSNVCIVGNHALFKGKRIGSGTADMIHGIAIEGSTSVSVIDLRFADFAGDGVTIKGAIDNDPVYSEKIKIVGCSFDNCMRNGLSVLSAIDCVVDRCVATNTNGKSPEAGFLLEPEGSSTRMTGIVLSNCSASNNKQFDFELVLGGNTTPITNSPYVTLDNCVSKDSTTYTSTVGFAILNHKSSMANEGYVKLQNCKAVNVANHGLFIRNIDKDGQPVEITNMTVVDTAFTDAGNLLAGADTQAAIVTNTALSEYADPGNVTIRGLAIVDNVRNRAPYYVSSVSTLWSNVVITDISWTGSAGTTAFPYVDDGTDLYATWLTTPFTVDRISNITISTRYSGWRLTNKGAASLVVYTLPPITAVFPWTYFDFYVEAANTLRIQPNAADKIHAFGNGDGKYVDADGVGVWVRIKYHDADGWLLETNRVASLTAEP